MRVLSITGRIPTKRVVVADIHPSTTDREVIDFAIEAAGETRSSLFGTSIERHGTVATVSLYTD